MVPETVVATLALVAVTLSLPFYLLGAWVMIDAETVTWGVLKRHLSYVVAGLTLNTVPVVTWMVPRLFDQVGEGLAAVHAFLGLQAYAMLVFALTGIVRIFQAKRRHGLYDRSRADGGAVGAASAGGEGRPADGDPGGGTADGRGDAAPGPTVDGADPTADAPATGDDVALSDLHENADAWRRRLRVGVFGYVVLWGLAYLVGVARYLVRYVL